jgi:hypothetical protein
MYMMNLMENGCSVITTLDINQILLNVLYIFPINIHINICFLKIPTFLSIPNYS